MRALKAIGILVAAVVVGLVVTLVASTIGNREATDSRQADLDPFYSQGVTIPADAKPGDILKSEPMTDLGWELTGATATRMIYVSQDPMGNLAISGGMVFVPTAPSVTPRPVVAYAHGTAGLGNACAPSRNPATPTGMPWVQSMMNNGWVLTATDYVGVGTAGNAYYLVGKSEASDVVNSVRAARNFPGANAGSRYTVMGHSQGGHSAVWTGELSKQIAPELDLLGVAASAPAMELGPLVAQSWNVANGWALGPPVLVSYPLVFPEVSAEEVASDAALGEYRDIAYECITDALVKGIVEADEGKSAFKVDPLTVAPFEQAIKAETPRPLPASMPMNVTVSVQDGVVFANTQALMQQQWCSSGANLQVNWLGAIGGSGTLGPDVAHQNTVLFGWPQMVTWQQQRFQGIAPTPNCTVTPPIAPYAGPGA